MRLNYTTSFPGSLACRWQILGLLGLHNHVSQSYDQSPLLRIYVYILLVLFLWRTLNNVSDDLLNKEK